MRKSLGKFKVIINEPHIRMVMAERYRLGLDERSWKGGKRDDEQVAA